MKKSARYCRDQEVRKKISLFLEVIRNSNVELACKRMGVHPSSYYRWWNRFRENHFKAEALKPRSRRPKKSPRRTSEKVLRKIRYYRFHYRYGPKRIQYYLGINHKIQISSSCIYRIIQRKGWVIRRYRTKKKNPHQKRYELPHPGFIQMDIKYVPKKIQGKQVYVYNAIDECTRWRFALAYREMSTLNAVHFVRKLVQVAPFTVKQIQTDNDVTFTYRFSPHTFDKRHPLASTLEELGIRHRFIPLGAKELNGKVERSHRIDEDEFFWKATYHSFALFQQDLIRWIHAYNHHRPHSSLNYLTPIEKLLEKNVIPLVALGIHLGRIVPLEPKLGPKFGIRLDTYFKYLDWIEKDPFHFSDVRNFYILQGNLELFNEIYFGANPIIIGIKFFGFRIFPGKIKRLLFPSSYGGGGRLDRLGLHSS